ncbi:Uncharacterized protein APZ42_014824 [Daphnia magna]|uniref:Uncharacterized protein n=1 Tax=Daphnia magna TaxID=35525 RepID=A0A162NXW2_9CRUS|nr:Uncharacterized protein APZ42_014824 [Daphnia magna]
MASTRLGIHMVQSVLTATHTLTVTSLAFSLMECEASMELTLTTAMVTATVIKHAQTFNYYRLLLSLKLPSQCQAAHLICSLYADFFFIAYSYVFIIAPQKKCRK